MFSDKTVGTSRGKLIKCETRKPTSQYVNIVAGFKISMHDHQAIVCQSIWWSGSPANFKLTKQKTFLFGRYSNQAKKMWVSRPYLAFGRRNPKLFYWITLVSVSTLQRKTFVKNGNLWQYQGNLSLDVEALTKQNGVRLYRKIKKKFKKKKLKPNYPT